MKQKDNLQDITLKPLFFLKIEDKIKMNEDNISSLFNEIKEKDKEIKLLNSCITDIFSELFDFKCKYCNGKLMIGRRADTNDPYNVYVFNNYRGLCGCGVNTGYFSTLEKLIKFLKDEK